MYAPNDNPRSSRSVLMTFLVRSWEYRRPRLWVSVRVACGIFNVVLGVLLRRKSGNLLLQLGNAFAQLLLLTEPVLTAQFE